MNASFTPLLAAGTSNAALYTFLLYTLAVFGLAWASSRLLAKKNFMSEYFLGSRGLGVWAFALTFAATSSSGGSFMGFPAKIYTHGWSLSLWIASYMVVPICAMGLLAKRINQVARISGSITVPDVVRDRFNSARFGLIATMLIVFFMVFNLVAQFKAGSVILRTLLADVPAFQDASGWLARLLSATTGDAQAGFFGSVEASYLLCLVSFSVAVIIYTTYGGFRAVVWTDVLQGIVMVAGVIILVPLALSRVGGLDNATQQLARMTPPELGTVTVALDKPRQEDYTIHPGKWLAMPRGEEIDRLNQQLSARPADDPKDDQKKVQQRIQNRIDRLQKSRDDLPLLFRVAKTSVIPAGQTEAAKVKVVEITTPEELENKWKKLQKKESDQLLTAVHITKTSMKPYDYGANQPGVYVTGPGPRSNSMDGFLPLGIAISFFFMWAISGAGQPSSMVRLMAFRDSKTLRRSIFTVAIYYSLIYFPLVIIFCCARVILPGMESQPDEIMPAIARELTEHIGYGWLAGLLVAAPFAAVMSTVDSFLLMISSALVRDVYQRNINPQASERTLKRLSYLFTCLVGAAAFLGAVNPPDFLQDIIIYTGSGLAACFLAPMVFALYWPRVNSIGAMSGMLAGFLAHLAMYLTGWAVYGSFFRPYPLFSFNPVVVGLFVSFVTVYVVSRMTSPPPEELVQKYFCIKET